MFSTLFSSAEKLVEAGEEITETRFRSRLSIPYLKRFLGIGGVALLVGAAMIAGEVTELLPAFVPSRNVGVLLVVPALGLLWIELEHHALMYHFTDKRFIEEKGILNKEFSSVPYRDITRVRISQGPLDRVLGVGQLKVEVRGTDEEEVVVKGVRHPQKFRLKLTSHKEAHDAATAQEQGEQDGQQDAGASPGPRDAHGEGAGPALTRERLEAELGRIQRRKDQLQEQYEQGQVAQKAYERRWYILEGEAQVVERQLDELEHTGA